MTMNLSSASFILRKSSAYSEGSTLGKGTSALARVLSETFRGQRSSGQGFPPEGGHLRFKSDSLSQLHWLPA